jgi:hypothetical protein
MASSLPHNSERRAAGVRRVPVERIVDVCAASAASAPAFQGWSMNVSGRGMSVRAAHLPELGTPLVVRFQEHGSEVIAEAIVAWRNETPRGSEFGVRFTALDSRSVQALKELCQSGTLRSVAAEATPGIFDVPDEPRGDEHDTERAPPASMNLHIEGMSAPMQAQVRQQGESRVALGSQLEFLRVGRNVEVEDTSLGDRRAACIDAVDVSIDPESHVPELVVSLRYDAAAPLASASTKPAASLPKPAAPGAKAAMPRPGASARAAFVSSAATPPMPSGMQMMPPPSSRQQPLGSEAPASSRKLMDDGEGTPASAKSAPASATTAPASAKSAPASATTAPASVKTAPASVKTAPASVKTAPASVKTAPATIETPPASVKPSSAAMSLAEASADLGEHEPASRAAAASAEETIISRSEPKIVMPSEAKATAPEFDESDEPDEGDVPLDELGVPVDDEKDDALSEPFRRLSTKASVEPDDELPPSRPSLEIEESAPSESERLRQRLDGVLDNLSSAARVAGERCRRLGEAASLGARSVAERARRAGQQALSQRVSSPRRRTAAPPRSLRNTGSRTLPRSQSSSNSSDAAARPRVSQRALLGASLLGIVLVGTWLGVGRGSAGADNPPQPAATKTQPAPAQASPVDALPADPAPSERPRVLLPPEDGEPEDVAEPTGVVAQVPLFGPTSLEPAVGPAPAKSARGAIEKIEKRALARVKPASDDFEPAPRPTPRRNPAASPEFRSGRLELPIIHRLRLDQPARNIRGERTATGFDVIVPGRKTMESGNAIARRDHRIAKVTTRNGAEGARVSFRFRSDIPAYKVRLRKDYIEFFISSD